MAEDALCLMLYDREESGETIPAASAVTEVRTEPGEFVSLIGCDTLEYRKRYGSKAVKKTLSIPSWLNDAAGCAEAAASPGITEQTNPPERETIPAVDYFGACRMARRKPSASASATVAT